MATKQFTAPAPEVATAQDEPTFLYQLFRAPSEPLPQLTRAQVASILKDFLNGPDEMTFALHWSINGRAPRAMVATSVEEMIQQFASERATR